MSERVWRNAQDCAKKQGLANGSRGWLTAASCQMLNTCKVCQKLKCHPSWSITGQKVQIGCLVTSRLELATQSSCESKPPASSVLKNLTLRIPFSPQYKYPLYPWNVESFQREYWERNKIDSFTIFTKRLFKFLYSRPLHCYILKRFITKTFSHHTHICEKAIWCLESS